MNKRVNVTVGTLDDMGRRLVNAWHRLERGEKVRGGSRGCRNVDSAISVHGVEFLADTRKCLSVDERRHRIGIQFAAGPAARFSEALRLLEDFIGDRDRRFYSS